MRTSSGAASRVDAGWVRRLRRGPRTLGEILRDASAAMAAQDEAERRGGDPFTYVPAHRVKRTLWDRLLRGRGRT
jgi:hypothetical protein